MGSEEKPPPSYRGFAAGVTSGIAKLAGKHLTARGFN
jgi:hypothetical protein